MAAPLLPQDVTEHLNQAPGQVRGKYKSIPTSSEAFIARKADELLLEH